MSDIIDKSTRQQELILESLIQQRAEVPKLFHSGRCHFCDEDVESPKLFCNGDCADDYDKQM